MLNSNNKTFFIVLLSAIFFGWYYNPRPTRKPYDFLKGLGRVSDVHGRAPGGLTYALGSNICVDSVVNSMDVFDNEYIAKSNILSSDNIMTINDNNKISSFADALSTFTYFLGKGAAAERASDKAVLSELVDKAYKSSTSRKSLGGNAALMAKKLSILTEVDPPVYSKRKSPIKIPSTIIIGGPIGTVADSMLPNTIARSASILDSDEVHLILEYGKGERVPYPSSAPNKIPESALLSAPRANRFIITADEANLKPDSMVDVIGAADAARADLIVIAGLHMMEKLDADIREHSLLTIANAIDNMSHASSVHIELASLSDLSYMTLIADKLFPKAHSLGFNEQEAAFLYEGIEGNWDEHTNMTKVSVASVTNAVAESVATLMRHVFRSYPSLTRLHYHSLAFHMIGYSSNNSNESIKRWKEGRGPVASGAVAATVDACKKDITSLDDSYVSIITAMDITVKQSESNTNTFSMSSADPVKQWTYKDQDDKEFRFTFAPVVVCNKPISTVGLGDSISAAGLAGDVLPVEQSKE